MGNIHPSAVIEEGAQIAASAKVGPFCVIGPRVVLHDNVEVKSHAIVTGDTEVGEGTVIFSFAVIGEIPQDLKFKGEASRLEIGKRNRIREHVTMNGGTEGGGGCGDAAGGCSGGGCSTQARSQRRWLWLVFPLALVTLRRRS